MRGRGNDAPAIGAGFAVGLASGRDLTATARGLLKGLLAVLLGAGVTYGRWLRFAIPGALVSIVGAIGVMLTV